MQTITFTMDELLLYSTGNYIQSLGIDRDGDNIRKEMCVCVCVCVCVCECDLTGSRCLAQPRKSTIL